MWARHDQHQPQHPNSFHSVLLTHLNKKPDPQAPPVIDSLIGVGMVGLSTLYTVFILLNCLFISDE